MLLIMHLDGPTVAIFNDEWVCSYATTQTFVDEFRSKSHFTTPPTTDPAGLAALKVSDRVCGGDSGVRSLHLQLEALNDLRCRDTH